MIGLDIRRLLRRTGDPPGMPVITAEDRRYLTTLYDDSVPLPEAAHAELRPENPRIEELRRAYSALDVPALESSRWNRPAIEGFLDLRWFRGESLFTWHYRELPRITALKYFVFLRYVRDGDRLGLLDRLKEDGAFGCWTFDYPGVGRVSRDLLQSVNELSFLERELGISRRETLSILDIGAGYGRLAHRATESLANLDDYCCVDAVPEATFISDWYLAHRGCSPPARVVRLDRLDRDLEPGTFDLAVNIHSFSECTEAAVAYWVDVLEGLRVPRLLIVPNEPQQLLTTETDASRRDYGPLLARAGYRLERCEPVISDPAARELLRLDDHFHLFVLG